MISLSVSSVSRSCLSICSIFPFYTPLLAASLSQLQLFRLPQFLHYLYLPFLPLSSPPIALCSATLPSRHYTTKRQLSPSVSALLLSPHALCLGSYLFRLSLYLLFSLVSQFHLFRLYLSPFTCFISVSASPQSALYLSTRSTLVPALPQYPLYLYPCTTSLPYSISPAQLFIIV